MVMMVLKLRPILLMLVVKMNIAIEKTFGEKQPNEITGVQPSNQVSLRSLRWWF